MKDEQMQKKGQNSGKCAGNPAIPPDEIMISPLGVESQSFAANAFAEPLRKVS